MDNITELMKLFMEDRKRREEDSKRREEKFLEDSKRREEIFLEDSKRREEEHKRREEMRIEESRRREEMRIEESRRREEDHKRREEDHKRRMEIMTQLIQDLTLKKSQDAKFGREFPQFSYDADSGEDALPSDPERLINISPRTTNDLTCDETKEALTSLSSEKQSLFGKSSLQCGAVAARQETRKSRPHLPSKETIGSSRKCFRCGKAGHVVNLCPEVRSGNRNTKVRAVNGTGRFRRKFAEIDFGGTKIKMQLDSGSDVTLIKTRTWEKIGSPKLEPSSTRLTAANGSPIQVKGQFQVKFTCKDHKGYGSCYVADDIDELLGIPWIEQIHPLSEAFNDICCRVELNVDVPPFWLVHPNIDEEAIVGDRLVLSCVTSGVPQPVVTWSRSLTNHVDIKVENVSTGYGRISLLSNGSLSINDVQKSDEGYFVCKSSNGVGPDVSRIISVHVHSPARFVSEGDKEENMMIGRGMTMTCNATGDHPTSIAWNKDKRNLDWMDDGRFKMTFFNLKDNIRSSALEISSLQRNDNGWYYCIAKNKYGSHVIKNLLRVLEPPDPPFDLKLLASGSRHARIGFKNGYNGNDAILGHYINVVGGEENGDLAAREILINSSNFGGQWTEVMTFHIDRLLPGVRYEINIKSMNSIGVGTWSDVLRIETQEEVPSSSPKDVRAVAIDSQSLNISWKPPSKNSNGIILGYHVGLKRGNEPFIFYSFKSISFCLLENLSKFSEYFVIVQAFNSKGVGPKSHPVKVVTNEDVPSDSPTDIKIQAIDSQTIHISWRPPTSINGILMGYDVIYEETNIPDDSKTTRTTNRNNMTITGLKKYNNYTFLVRAFTAVGRGVSSRPLIVSTLEDVAGVPTNLKVLPSSRGEMSVYWQPPLERNGIIIGYVVDVCQINNENISNEFLYPSSTLNCILSNLTLHIEVRVTVKALTSIGVGPDTEPVIARVLDTAQARVVESSKSILIDSKVPITLPCTAVGQPLPSKTWRINGNNLNVKDCCFINLDGSLTIELPDETTGNYECVVENMHGKDQVEYVVSAENLPSPLKLISKQFDSLQFQWSNNYFIKSKEYLLQYRPCIENDESGQNDFRDEDWITFNLTTERNFTIKNLDCGKEYEIQIRDHKMKKSIDINKYNTTGDSPIMPVQSLLIHEINSSSISLNLTMWLDGGCPISRYKVEYQTNINDYWLLMKDNVSGDQEYLQLDLHPDTWYRIRVDAFNSAGRTECILNFATPPLQMTNDSLDGSHAARLTKLKIQRHVPLYDRMEFMLPITTAIMFTMVTATILILRRKRKILDKRCQQNNLSSLLQSDYQPSKHEIETINFRNIDSELYASRISEVESKTENRTGNIIYKKLHLGSRLKTNPTEIRRNKKSKKKRVYPSRPPRTSTPKQSETMNLHKFHANEQEKHVDLDLFLGDGDFI